MNYFKKNVNSPAIEQADTAVYREQIKLLFQQLPAAMFAALIMVIIFTYMVWDADKTRGIITWLSFVLIVIVANFTYGRKFKHNNNEESSYRNAENTFLIGTVASAILWGSTSLWLEPTSSIQQQVFLLTLIIGLTGGAVAALASRLYIYQTFLILILAPYILRFIYLGTPTYLSVAGLSCIYIILMLPISKRVNTVITNSLYLRFKNLELLESYKDADNVNKKANEALFEIMKKNKEEELKLEKSESFLRAILDTANDSIITTDKNGIILTVNHAIERDFGYTPDEMIGQSINMTMEDDMGYKHDKYIEQYFQSDSPVLVGRMLDVTGKRKDGSIFPLEITVSETRVDNEIYFTGIIRDITVRKAQEAAMEAMMLELADAKKDLEVVNSLLHNQNKELTELSEHDALTKLPNRRYLRKAFTQEWPRHQRYKRPITVILIDVDYFKRYNDKYGHQEGDACLQKIANVFIKNISRPADFIARYGGEEFIAVLPETDVQGAQFIAEKMREAVADLHIEHKDSPVGYVTISGGVACKIPTSDNSPDELIKHADEALYLAKGSGRNRICQFNDLAAHLDNDKSGSD